MDQCHAIDFMKRDNTVETSTDCSNASRKLFDSVADKIVLVQQSNDESGTGVIINAGDEFVTNAHVAAHSTGHITLTDGRTFKTRLEKLDDVHDLAKMRIVGLEPDPKRALDLNNARTPEPDEQYTAIGHPFGSKNLTVAVGKYKESGNLYGYANGRHIQAIVQLNALAESQDPKLADLKKDAAASLDAERWRAALPVRPGNSGSPTFDKTDLFGGIVAEQIPGKNFGLVIPPQVVREFIATPETKFDFVYENENTPQEKLTIKRKDGKPFAPLV